MPKAVHEVKSKETKKDDSEEKSIKSLIKSEQNNLKLKLKEDKITIEDSELNL